ncbi:hypothetical protein J7T55_007270 [Diaporthe amygdali]|uniref:uncharacterized protein n=1 Tax=Phomopsis amygdali TaxID=1214568 RepID=UPI0022FE7473|nr:uncharacterized protein J7T55_007270 [Diaporthe amygdali]KAJ0108151.1 hypothetical protein J7T55_007270 [Diaporthe amygdali]
MANGDRIHRFGHVFVEGQDQYLFVKSLGYGASSQAQLVLHVQSGDLLVRKVKTERLCEAEKNIPDRENVLFYLQQQAAQRDEQPNIVRLFSANDVWAVQGPGTRLWSRVFYLKYYNGGSVGELYMKYVRAKKAMPSSLILRLLTHVVAALNFISSCNVLHADLHDENIFLEVSRNEAPNFYIADFGEAEQGALTNASNKFPEDVFMVCMNLENWLETGPDLTDDRDELWHYLNNDVHSVLADLVDSASNQLPDLRPLLEVLQAAPQGLPVPLDAWILPQDEDTLMPLYHTTEQGALEASRIAGPWYVMEVALDIHNCNGLPKPIRVGLEAHDHPGDI